MKSPNVLFYILLCINSHNVLRIKIYKFLNLNLPQTIKPHKTTLTSESILRNPLVD